MRGRLALSTAGVFGRKPLICGTALFIVVIAGVRVGSSAAVAGAATMGPTLLLYAVGPPGVRSGSAAAVLALTEALLLVAALGYTGTAFGATTEVAADDDDASVAVAALGISNDSESSMSAAAAAAAADGIAAEEADGAGSGRCTRATRAVPFRIVVPKRAVDELAAASFVVRASLHVVGRQGMHAG